MSKYLKLETMTSSPTSTPSNDPQTPTPVSGANSDPLSPSSEHESRRITPSAQLKRWSRARSFRSGQKLNRPAVHRYPEETNNCYGNSQADVTEKYNGSGGNACESEVMTPSARGEGRRNGEYLTDVTAGVKSIYMVSDGTGWTAEHSVKSALGQFEHGLVDRACPVNTHLFSGIDSLKRLMEIIAQAAKEGAMVVYTLSDPSMAESARKACRLLNVTSINVLSPVTETIASHLGVTPCNFSPRDKPTLPEEFLRRIESVEFALRQDDGALPLNLHEADIIFVGVSRTGKTPLSIYLAQKGYKVANVPIVMNVELPRSLFEVDPEKVFALTLSPVVLQNVRIARVKSLGLSGEEPMSSYSGMDSVKNDLEHANEIFRQNPAWRVLEVTGKAIEETAEVVLRLYHDRKNRSC